MARGWKDVMLGEIQAKREAEESRRERRKALRDKALDRYQTVVRPAISRLLEGASTLAMEESVDTKTALVWVRVSGKRGWVEIEFDPYQPLVFLRRRTVEQDTTRLETLDYDDVSDDWVAAWCEPLLA